MLFTSTRSVRIGKNCALCLGYCPRPTASGGIQDVGHSFSQYGPPGWWITYIYCKPDCYKSFSLRLARHYVKENNNQKTKRRKISKNKKMEPDSNLARDSNLTRARTWFVLWVNSMCKLWESLPSRHTVNTPGANSFSTRCVGSSL